MGSPFNVCNLNLEGDYIPDLSNLEFQDIAIISNDQHTIYLVIWEIKNNEPGFKIMGVADFGYDFYLLAIAKLLHGQYFRLLDFYFHTLIQQRLNFKALPYFLC
jgi:hypothetical protein